MLTIMSSPASSAYGRGVLICVCVSMYMCVCGCSVLGIPSADNHAEAGESSFFSVQESSPPHRQDKRFSDSR